MDRGTAREGVRRLESDSAMRAAAAVFDLAAAGATH